MPARDPLQGTDDLSSRFKGVRTQVRHRSMSPFSFYFKIKAIHGGHERTGPDTYGSLWNIGPHMAAQRIVHLWIFHHPGFDHRLGPAGSLFRRLE